MKTSNTPESVSSMSFYAHESSDTTLHGLLCSDCLAKNASSFDPRWVKLEQIDYTKICDRCGEQVLHLLNPNMVGKLEWVA